MKAYREWMYRSTCFMTSALVGGEWSISRPGRFTPEERAPGTHWLGSWVDLRAGLDDLMERKLLILPGLELRPLGRPASSYSLYQLRYFRNLFYTDGRTPWASDQPVARPLPTRRTTQAQNKRTHTAITWVGFELTISAFGRAKTVHVLDRAATLIGDNVLTR
jgi:hypothetical protein